ncbi:hypothetical protein F7725_001944 [Dissostichus mawsoni]|uniref:Uncharacterized protein n=1 Tax=Dissostichus mawsoni TaxID=36200 RepID=A0A7J5Y118_DISMA|nr:hypothetical protein F7725_001944 [Dissostichus mawsoni]
MGDHSNPEAVRALKRNSLSSTTRTEERQTRELQRAIQENKRKLVDVQQKRLRAEEDIIHW